MLCDRHLDGEWSSILASVRGKQRRAGGPRSSCHEVEHAPCGWEWSVQCPRLCWQSTSKIFRPVRCRNRRNLGRFCFRIPWINRRGKFRDRMKRPDEEKKRPKNSAIMSSHKWCLHVRKNSRTLSALNDKAGSAVNPGVRCYSIKTESCNPKLQFWSFV